MLFRAYLILNAYCLPEIQILLGMLHFNLLNLIQSNSLSILKSALPFFKG